MQNIFLGGLYVKYQFAENILIQIYKCIYFTRNINCRLRFYYEN